MIVFFVSAPHAYTFKGVMKDCPGVEVRLFPYEQLRTGSDSTYRFERATYIFTDLDRLPSDTLRFAGRLFRQLRGQGIRVLNDPARFLSRSGLLRQLYRAGFNRFDAHRAEYGERPQRWPVFLRTEGDHIPPMPELYGDIAALEQGIVKAIDKGIPLSRLLIVEFAAEPVQPGIYRKLASFRIGPVGIAHPNVHNPHWIAKDGVRGTAGDSLYNDELRIVRDNPFGPMLEKAFEIAGIDYGRADFGVVDGRVQVYEINTNPAVGWNDDRHPNAARQESMATFRRNYIAALSAIDTR